ncbi:MAG: hypothetical protein K8R79_03490, partial [Calditrichales bacterium]|nr:hypothetical protein [Calditrichales bacterium]
MGFIFKILRIDFSWGDFVKSFSQESNVKWLNFINEIWGNYIVFNSPVQLYQDFSKIKTFFKPRSFVKQALLIIPLIIWAGIYAVFYLFKYFISVLFELCFRIAHALLMLIGLFIFMIYLTGRLIFTPLTK